MGWFSRKKKIFVSSVVYNLAGGPEDRIRYLPSTIASKVIANTQFSMSETLQSALINGPGMRMRRFGQWARSSGYANIIGQQAGRLTVGSSLDFNAIAGQIPVDAGSMITIQDAKIGEADYGAWADEWMLANHPDQVNADYELDFDERTNTIFIRFPDNNPVYQFNPVGFDPLSPYLYVSYTISALNVRGPIVPGSTIPVSNAGQFPSTAGWTLTGSTSTPRQVDLKTTVVTKITYSDARPSESSTSTTTRSAAYSDLEATYELITYLGQNPEGTEINSLRSIMHQFRTGAVAPTSNTTTKDEIISGGVTKTTMVTTTVENVVTQFSYRIDTQTIIDKSWSALKTIIYKKGSGNAVFDAMFAPETANSTFLPFIPVRLDNEMIGPTLLPEVYALNKKALPRATGSEYDPLVQSLRVNSSLRDIDYGYITFGVALNTKEDSSKKYLYKFFQTMLLNAGGGVGEYNSWRSAWQIADQSQRNWLSWKNAQGEPSNPLFGAPEPNRIPYPAPWGNQLRVSSNKMNYDMRVHWASLEEETFTGLAWEGAKQGQIRVVKGITTTYEQLIMSGGAATWETVEHDAVKITWQDGLNTYRTMSVTDLWHVNMIYKGKAVYTGGAEALNDPEESGFIIPMHEGIYKAMSLVDTSQMSMASGYMVFNCYKVVKQKWYQTSWFKIVLVIIVIVVTVITAGAGGASAGLLGTAAGVGASLGFAGVTAIIVGTIANAVAAMLLTQILTMGATALFGDKVGTIIGAIASVVAVSVGSSMMSGQGVAVGFSNLSNAENILKLSVAAGNGLAAYVGAKTEEVLKQTQEVVKQYGHDSQAIMNAWEKNLGYGQVSIDPTVLTDSSQKYDYIPESSSVFMSRTLLTGSEIAGMTNDMLSNFTRMTLSTELE